MKKNSSSDEASERQLLAEESGFTYNPKDFRNKVIPGGSIPGCTGSRELKLGV
jgi:hypothetical protein